MVVIYRVYIVSGPEGAAALQRFIIAADRDDTHRGMRDGVFWSRARAPARDRFMFCNIHKRAMGHAIRFV